MGRWFRAGGRTYAAVRKRASKDSLPHERARRPGVGGKARLVARGPPERAARLLPGTWRVSTTPAPIVANGARSLGFMPFPRGANGVARGTRKGKAKCTIVFGGITLCLT